MHKSKSRLPRLLVTLVALYVSFSADRASAHAVGETYVWVNVEEDRLAGRIEINLDDLRNRLGIEVPESADRETRISIVEDHREQIFEYV